MWRKFLALCNIFYTVSRNLLHELYKSVQCGFGLKIPVCFVLSPATPIHFFSHKHITRYKKKYSNLDFVQTESRQIWWISDVWKLYWIAFNASEKCDKHVECWQETSEAKHLVQIKQDKTGFYCGNTQCGVKVKHSYLVLFLSKNSCCLFCFVFSSFFLFFFFSGAVDAFYGSCTTHSLAVSPLREICKYH